MCQRLKCEIRKIITTQATKSFNRPDMQATVDMLKGLGGDVVTTDDALRQDLGATLASW